MIDNDPISKKLVAYTRRSTDKQAASPRVQEREIREWCKDNGHELLRVYHEVAITGKSHIERRTVLPNLIAEIKEKSRDFDGLIVWKFDRLCRNTGEYHRIMEILDHNKCEIVSLKDPAYGRKTAADRVVTNILADFAAYERELTGERIFAHNLERVLAGKWPGGKTPVGFDYDKETGKFSLNDRSSDIRRVFELYVASSGNACITARRLQAEGIPGVLSSNWYISSVTGVLRRAIYRRQLLYADNRIDASEIVPEIVPPDLIASVDALMVSTREFRPRQRETVRAYSGILKCGVCGERMVGSLKRTKKPAGNYAYRGWSCRLFRYHRICDSREVSERHIDKLVGEALKLMLMDYQEEIEASRKAAKPVPKKASGITAVDVGKMRERLIGLYLREQITDKEFATQTAQLDRFLAIEPKPKPTPKLMDVQASIDLISDQWETVPAEIKRKLFLTIGVTITVGNHRDTEPEVIVTSNLTDHSYAAKGTLSNYRDIVSVCAYRTS
jgi:site-specific DNA recombinase